MNREDFLKTNVEREEFSKLINNDWLKKFVNEQMVELTSSEQDDILKEMGDSKKRLIEVPIKKDPGNILSEVLNKSIKSGKVPMFLHTVNGKHTIGFVGSKNKNSTSKGYDMLLPIIFEVDEDFSSAKPIGVASAPIPNLKKSVYTESGTVNTQPYVKILGDGPRNEKMVKTSAFDLKRYVNTFFKKTNDTAKDILESFDKKVFSNKIGSTVYKYGDRSALQSNSPVLQNLHKTITAASVLTTSDVGSGKSFFGNITGTEVFLDSNLMRKMINGVTESENVGKTKHFLMTYFDDGSDVSYSQRALKMFESSHGYELSSNDYGKKSNDFIQSNKKKFIDYISNDVNAFKETVKDYFMQEAKRNINPFYNLGNKSSEQRIAKFMKNGGSAEEFVSALTDLKSDRKDYFGSINSMIGELKKRDGAITKEEISDIIYKHQSKIESGPSKALLGKIESRLDFVINNDKDLANNLKDGKTGIRKIMDSVTKQYSEVATLISLAESKRKTEKISFEDFEMAAMTDKNMILDRSKFNRNNKISSIIENKISEINKVEKADLLKDQRVLYVDGSVVGERVSQYVENNGLMTTKMLVNKNESSSLPYVKTMKASVNKELDSIGKSDLVMIVDSATGYDAPGKFNNHKNNEIFEKSIRAKKDIIVKIGDIQEHYIRGEKTDRVLDVADYNSVYLKANPKLNDKRIMESAENSFKNIANKNNIIMSSNRTDVNNRVEISKDVLSRENVLRLSIFDVVDEEKNRIDGVTGYSEAEKLAKIKAIIAPGLENNLEKKGKGEVLTFLQGKTLTFNNGGPNGALVARAVTELLNEESQVNGISKESKTLQLKIVDEVFRGNAIKVIEGKADIKDNIEFSNKINSTLLLGSLKNKQAIDDIYSTQSMESFISMGDTAYKARVDSLERSGDILIAEKFSLFENFEKHIDKIQTLGRNEKTRLVDEISKDISLDNKGIEELNSLLSNKAILPNDKRYITLMNDFVMFAESVAKNDTTLQKNTDDILAPIVDKLQKGYIDSYEIGRMGKIEAKSPVEYSRARNKIYNEFGFDIKTGYSKGPESLVIDNKNIDNLDLSIKKALDENKVITVDKKIIENFDSKKKLDEALGKYGINKDGLEKFYIDSNRAGIVSNDVKLKMLKGTNAYAGTMAFKKDKILTLDVIGSTNKVSTYLDLINKQNSADSNAIENELFSPRYFASNRLNMSMKGVTTNGMETVQFKIPMFMDGQYIETEFNTKYTMADAAKMNLEETKRTMFESTPEKINEMRDLQNRKVMLGIFEDSLTKNARKDGNIKYVNKSYSELEKILESVKGKNDQDSRDIRVAINNVRIARGVRSVILNEYKDLDFENNKVVAFEKMVNRNSYEIQVRNGSKSIESVSIKIKDNKVDYGYDINEYTKRLESIGFEFNLDGKTDDQKAAIITKQLLEDEMISEKTRRELLFKLPSTDGNFNREVYKQVNFMLSNETGSMGKSINNVTFKDNMEKIFKIKDDNFDENTTKGVTQLYKKVFSTDYFEANLKKAFTTGESLNTTSISNKQQNAIAGKFFTFLSDGIVDMNFFNKEGQRMYQSADLRGDLVYKGADGVNTNVNVLMSKVIWNITDGSPSSPNSAKSVVAERNYDLINNAIEKEIPGLSRYENNQVKHLMLIGDVNDYNSKAESIYGYNQTFQEGSLMSRKAAVTSVSVMNQKHSFSIYDNIDYKAFSDKVGIGITNKDELYSYLSEDKTRALDLFSTEVRKSYDNETMLTKGLKDISEMKGSTTEKLYELESLRVAGLINKKVSENVAPGNVIKTLDRMISNSDSPNELIKLKTGLEDIRGLKVVSPEAIEKKLDSIYTSIYSDFFGGVKKEDKTLMLDNSVFLNTIGDKYQYRKVSNGAILKDVEIKRDSIGVIIEDVSEVSKGSKMYSSGQKSTTSVIPSKFEIVENGGRVREIAGIINTKTEKRAQVGSRMFDMLRTTMTFVHEQDHSKLGAYTESIKDILDTLNLEVRNINKDTFDLSFVHQEKLINDPGFDLHSGVTVTPEKMTEYHYENKKIKEAIINKYGDEYKDGDKADFALVHDIAQRYEDFNKKELNSVGENVIVKAKELRAMIGDETVKFGAEEVFFKVYTTIAKSAASENKKNKDGMKLNYIMEKMFGMQGYKTLQEEITESSVKNGVNNLVQVLGSLNDEYSIKGNLDIDKSLVTVHQEKLVKSFLDSLGTLYNRDIDSYNENGDTAHMLGYGDTDGKFTKKVVMIDLAKIENSEYFIKDLGEDSKSIVDLSKFETIREGIVDKQLNIVAGSLEHKLAIDYIENKNIDNLSKYTDEARSKKVNLGELAKVFTDEEYKINIFDSYIGKQLVEGGIINKGAIDLGRIKGEVLIVDSNAVDKFKEMKDARDFIKASVSKFDIFQDDKEELVKKIDNLFEGNIKNKSEMNIGGIEFFDDMKKEIKGMEKALYEQTDISDSYKMQKLLENREAITKANKTLMFIEDNFGKTEVMNNFYNYNKNYGIQTQIVNLDFDLQDNAPEKIVASDSIRDIESIAKRYIKIADSENELNRLKASYDNNFVGDLKIAIDKIINKDTEITTEKFSKQIDLISSTLGAKIHSLEEDGNVGHIKNIYDNVRQVKELLFDYNAKTALFVKNKSLANLSDDGSDKAAREVLEASMKSIDEVFEEVKKSAEFSKNELDELMDSDQKHLLNDPKGDKAYRIKILQEVNDLSGKLTNEKMLDFELSLSEKKLSSKKSDLFKSMRFNMGEQSRVVMPIEGSNIEEIFASKLFKNGTVKGKTLANLEKVFGKNLVNNSIMNSSLNSLNEKDVVEDFLSSMINKKQRNKLLEFVDIKTADEMLQSGYNLKAKVSEVFDKLGVDGKLSIKENTRYKGLSSAAIGIVLKNRLAELSEIVFVDRGVIPKTYDDVFGRTQRAFVRDSLFISRHPQQTQYHTTGVLAVAIDTERQTDNEFINAIKGIVSKKSSNEAGIVLFGKKTAKNKRGDFDGDKFIVSSLKDQGSKNIALFQSQSINNVFHNNETPIEFVSKNNTVIDLTKHKDKTVREFLKEFGTKENIKELEKQKSNLDVVIGKNWGDTNRALLGLEKFEYEGIIEVNRINDFYIKGRVKDEFGKHRNAFKEFIYQVSENKDFADVLDDKKKALSTGMIDKSTFDKDISNAYETITGESGKDFTKFLGKTEFTKFFDSKDNVSSYNKAVNIKNTGIVFEETAKYRTPGLSMMYVDINKMISENEYLNNMSGGNSVAKDLEAQFKDYKTKQFMFSKLADIYYDNANEAAISAKHGLSLDGLKDVKDKIQMFQSNKFYGDVAVDVAEKISLNRMNKAQTIDMLEGFKKVYYNQSFGYEYLDTADKEFNKSVGSSRIRVNPWEVDIKSSDTLEELRAEMTKLKQDNVDIYDMAKKSFVKNSSEKEFEEFLEGRNLKNNFLDMFKFGEKEVTISNLGLDRTVSVSILGYEPGSNGFEDMLSKAGKSTGQTDMLSDLQGVMQRINRMKAESIKTSHYQDVSNEVTAFSKSFGITDNKSAKTLLETFSSILVVLGQNERNAELDMETFDKGLDYMRSLPDDKDFIKNAMSSLDGNEKAFSTRLMSVAKTVSAVMGDVSITSRFSELFEVKLKGDFISNVVDETGINSKEFKGYLAEQSEKLSSEKIQLNRFGYIDYLNRNGIDIDKFYNEADKLETKEVSEDITFLSTKLFNDIRYHRNAFETNPSAEISKIVNFATASTNAGVSDYERYLNSVMDSVRTGNSLDLSNSAFSQATKQTRLAMKEIEYNTILNLTKDEGIKNYYVKNIEFFKTKQGEEFYKALNFTDGIDNTVAKTLAVLDVVNGDHLGSKFVEHIKNASSITDYKKIISDLQEESSVIKSTLDANTPDITTYIENRSKEANSLFKVRGLLNEKGDVDLSSLRKLSSRSINNLLSEIQIELNEKVKLNNSIELNNKNLDFEFLMKGTIGILDDDIPDLDRLSKIVRSYDEIEGLGETHINRFLNKKIGSNIDEAEKVKWGIIGSLIKNEKGSDGFKGFEWLNDKEISEDVQRAKMSNFIQRTERIVDKLKDSEFLKNEIDKLRLTGTPESFFEAMSKSKQINRLATMSVGQQILDDMVDRNARKKIKDFSRRHAENFFGRYEAQLQVKDIKIEKDVFIKNLEADFAIKVSQKMDSLDSKEFAGIDEVLNTLRKDYKNGLKAQGAALISNDRHTLEQVLQELNTADVKRYIKGSVKTLSAIAGTLLVLGTAKRIFSSTEVSTTDDKKDEMKYEMETSNSARKEYADINVIYKKN